VLNVYKVRKSFNARFLAERREYIYNILLAPELPMYLKDFVWQIPVLKNLEAMREASLLFSGSQDYTAFSLTSAEEKSGIRNIFASELTVSPAAEWLGSERHTGSMITYRIEANGFLYRMVRRIVGVLVAVANEELSLVEVKKILESKDRSLLKIPPAPAAGLVLNKVKYNKSEGCEDEY